MCVTRELKELREHQQINQACVRLLHICSLSVSSRRRWRNVRRPRGGQAGQQYGWGPAVVMCSSCAAALGSTGEGKTEKQRAARSMLSVFFCGFTSTTTVKHLQAAPELRTGSGGMGPLKFFHNHKLYVHLSVSAK